MRKKLNSEGKEMKKRYTPERIAKCVRRYEEIWDIKKCLQKMSWYSVFLHLICKYDLMRIAILFKLY